MDAFAAKRLEVIFGKKIPPADLIEFPEVVVSVKKDEAIGLELKSFFVTNMTLTGPCADHVKVGDVLLHVNGAQVSAMDKLAKQVQDGLKGQPVGKVSLKLMRLKREVVRPALFPVLPKREGYVQETLVLYQLKGFFHLGLDIKEIEGKLVVCDTVENSLSDITFSLGETIIDVDGEKTVTCSSFNERVKKSLEIRNFCLITVEYPMTDPLKNLLRIKITHAQKECRINRIPQDAKFYANEGLTVFRQHGNDPLKSAWAGEKASKDTAKSTISEMSNRTRIDEKVKETDVPSEWNSRLFVRLPPMKTVESESLAQ